MTTPSKHDIRCSCNRLLARKTRQGIELKCPRCRQVVAIRLEDLDAQESELVFSPPVSSAQ